MLRHLLVAALVMGLGACEKSHKAGRKQTKVKRPPPPPPPPPAKTVEGLIAQLKHEDLRTRRAAVKALATKKDKRVFDALVSALDDALLRGTVIRALGALGDPRAVEPLLKWDAVLHRDMVRKALVKLGAAAVPTLVSQLKCDLEADPGDQQIGVAGLALGAIGKPAVDPLKKRLKHTEAATRACAALVLGRTGDKGATKLLVRRLRDEEHEVRLAAIVALGSTKDASVVKRLAAFFCRRYSELLAASLYGYSSYRHAEDEQALASLQKIEGPEVTKTLVSLMRRRGCYNRHLAAKALGKLKDRATIKPLIAALEDSDSAVRQEAAEALAKLHPASFQTLLSTLETGNVRAKAGAAVALGRTKDKRAVKPLIDSIASRDAMLRHAAASALDRLDDPRAHPVFDKAMGDKDIPVIGGAYGYFLKGDRHLDNEALLIEAMKKYQGEMITDYLNSGNAKLAQAAEKLAKKLGLSVIRTPVFK